MSKKLKTYVNIFYFVLIYFTALLGAISEYNVIFKYFFLSFLLVMLILYTYIIYHIYTKITNNIYVYIKIIIFTLFIGIYFFIEQFFFYIFLYGMDGVGFLQRNGLVNYNYSGYEFTWKETLFWHFLFLSYYPIYIFIFFKPFVNHLDKSIRKIKEDKNNE